MDIFVCKLQPCSSKTRYYDDDDDDESSDDSIDDDNDDDDDDTYGLEKDYISNIVKPMGELTMKSEEFNVDHVYDIVRGLCYNVYCNNDNEYKSI